jgi:hypothetical protein
MNDRDDYDLLSDEATILMTLLILEDEDEDEEED